MGGALEYTEFLKRTLPEIVRIKKLSNGRITVIHRINNNKYDDLSLAVGYYAGSNSETPEMPEGTAHLYEHCVVEGQEARRLESGLEMGGLNAVTGHTRIAAIGRSPSMHFPGAKKDIEKVLKYIKLFLEGNIDPKEVPVQKKVITDGEMKYRADDLLNPFFELLGNRNTLGTPESLQKINLDHLEKYREILRQHEGFILIYGPDETWVGELTEELLGLFEKNGVGKRREFVRLRPGKERKAYVPSPGRIIIGVSVPKDVADYFSLLEGVRGKDGTYWKKLRDRFGVYSVLYGGLTNIKGDGAISIYLAGASPEAVRNLAQTLYNSPEKLFKLPEGYGLENLKTKAVSSILKSPPSDTFEERLEGLHRVLKMKEPPKNCPEAVRKSILNGNYVAVGPKELVDLFISTVEKYTKA